MTEIFSVPQQNCPVQRKGWTDVEEMWNLIRTKGYLSQTQKLLQNMQAGKKKLLQQWQEISPLTNDSNGQRRQYPDPKESASLRLMAWRWGKITLAWVQINILWLQYSCNVFLKLENNSHFGSSHTTEFYVWAWWWKSEFLSDLQFRGLIWWPGLEWHLLILEKEPLGHLWGHRNTLCSCSLCKSQKWWLSG